MKIPSGIRIFGDTDFRDTRCASESAEQITFVSRIDKKYHDTYGRIIIHPKNEQRLRDGQFSRLKLDKAMASLNKGASDIIIPGCPSFVCEIKRKDHTLSKISEEQVEYLLACQMTGAFACIALGCDSAMDAFECWLTKVKR